MRSQRSFIILVAHISSVARSFAYFWKVLEGRGPIMSTWPDALKTAGPAPRPSSRAQILGACKLVSTCPHLPSQIAKSRPFANELNAEQYAKQPDRRYREVGPKIESDQDRNDAARQDPTPVRKGSYSQRKNYLRNALDHEVHEQQKREHEKARPSMTN